MHIDDVVEQWVPLPQVAAILLTLEFSTWSGMSGAQHYVALVDNRRRVLTGLDTRFLLLNKGAIRSRHRCGVRSCTTDLRQSTHGPDGGRRICRVHHRHARYGDMPTVHFRTRLPHPMTDSAPRPQPRVERPNRTTTKKRTTPQDRRPGRRSGPPRRAASS